MGKQWIAVMLSLVCLAAALIVAGAGSLSTAMPAVAAEELDNWVVTSTLDSGVGSLRQAMLDAQSGDTITFDPAVFPPGTPPLLRPRVGPCPR